MVAAFQEIQDGLGFKVGDRVRGNWLAGREKFGKVVRLYQKRRSPDWWAEIEWDGGDSSKLRTDQIALAEDSDQEQKAQTPDLQVGDKVRILYCEGDDNHNQQWCDRVGVINRLHPNRASNQVQVDFNDQDQEQHWAFDYSLVRLMEERPQSEAVAPEATKKPVEGDWVSGSSVTGTVHQGLVEGYSLSGLVKILTPDNKRAMLNLATVQVIDPPTSETDSEVEELPILTAIASVEGGNLEPSESAETSSLATVEGGALVEQLFAEINALDAQGTEAEQTAIAAGRAALEIRREQGRKLQEAKDQVVAAEGYGSWGKRFASACPNIHIRTASNYMRLHREWDAIASQAGDRLNELTFREAIALLQNKPVLSAAPEPESELSFEEVVTRFGPWGEFARTKDPKFKYSFSILGKTHAFRGLREAMRWHEENCYDWNTLEARQRQQQERNQALTCVACKHRQLIGDGSEFHCNARGSSHGVRENLAPECRHYKTRFMDVPGREQAIAPTPVTEVRNHVSEVVTDCEDLDQGEAIATGDQLGTFSGGEATETLDSGELGQGDQPAPQPHPAGVLASSARGKAEDEAENDERYTPKHLTDAALKVCGVERFDLDPATNDRANPHVPCKVAYTIAEDGLQQDWSAETLWLNPPYSKMTAFTSKLIDTWKSERVNHAFVLTKGDFSTQWCQRLLRTCSAVCLINHRLTFEAPDRELGTSFFASLLFYFGPDADSFVQVFDPNIGTVLAAYGSECADLYLIEGREGLDALAESIALREQRYAELLTEHLAIGDRVLLHGDISKSPWEVIGQDGNNVTLIGPFMQGSETLLRSRSNPAICDISGIRRIVTGGEA